jgi:glycosyltransferase involved in cell wall biosynthesis
MEAAEKEDAIVNPAYTELMQTTPLKICAFGCFDEEGGRSWIIRKGLEGEGHTFIFCNTIVPGIWPKFCALRRRWREIEHDIDVIYVVFLGHYFIPLAWFFSRKRNIPIYFDAFVSLYDTEICDRARHAPWGLHALFYTIMDWLSCRLADLISMDTAAHTKYMLKRYHIPPEKIIVVPIGCRTDIFYPKDAQRKPGPFKVEFHGNFIPLQGIETILHAARILQERRADIVFDIMGKGQTYPAMRKLAEKLQLKNVTFTGSLPIEKVAERVHQADVSLGIFGTSVKADNVFPHKSYEALAIQKPLITGRTTAATELLEEGKHALLSEPGNPQELAENILLLQSKPALRRSLAEEGHRFFLERFSYRAIVAELQSWLAKYSSRG